MNFDPLKRTQRNSVDQMNIVNNSSSLWKFQTQIGGNLNKFDENLNEFGQSSSEMLEI